MTGFKSDLLGFIENSHNRVTLSDIFHKFSGSDKSLTRSIKKVLRELVDQGYIEYVNEAGLTFAEISYSRPVRLSDSVVVSPPGFDFKKENKDDVVVKMENSTSFGRGNHPTTRLCLDAFEKSFEYTNYFNSSVLDIGCGTGILAIASVLKGFVSAYAVDIDPVAVFDTRANIYLNNLEKKVSADFDWPSDMTFDLLFANLRPPTLKEFKTYFIKYLNKKGFLIISGFKDDEKNELLDNFSGYFEVMESFHDKDWCSALLALK